MVLWGVESIEQGSLSLSLDGDGKLHFQVLAAASSSGSDENLRALLSSGCGCW